MKNMVKDVLQGHNRLLYTYGVTNSGKTYTIQGEIFLLLIVLGHMSSDFTVTFMCSFAKWVCCRC